VKLLSTILAIVLMVPVVLLVGVALGPAALVLLFIAGIAFVVGALIQLGTRVGSR
jgi:di/tricarboxylate transporter